MKRKTVVILIVLGLLVGCSRDGKSERTSDPAGAPDAAALPTAAAELPALDGPYGLVSSERLLATLTDLTAIEPYSGWRNSATEGEVQAIEYLAGQLDGLAYLQELGLELERQEFPVFCSTEIWQSKLVLIVDGEEIEVPADGLRGARDVLQQSLRMDSDGQLNDSERDPRSASGPILLVRTAEEIDELEAKDVQGKIVLLDFAAIDQALLGTNEAVGIAWQLIELDPAGVLLITENSMTPGESHGSFIGDGSALRWVGAAPNPPVLYARLEDLTPAGIQSWDDLEEIEQVKLTVDQDVFSPGVSGNLVAHIPGADSTHSLILGAHVDSPNSPGAMDDGSGTSVLLEVARVLNEAELQPAVDLVLVWFGSEELGLYGSSHFALTHQELLDSALAMLQIDMLSRPLDGIDATINLVSWSYGRLGNEQLAWPGFLGEVAAGKGIETWPVDYYGIESDNSSFTGFDVPNANMIYINSPAMERWGPIHYAAHIHDPYDTVETARPMDGVLVQMAQLALGAVLETDAEAAGLRVAPAAEHRALFVGSHTESIHMAPTALIDLGQALAWEGYDVDLIPYGQAVTPADLEGVELVIALPVLDYPSPDGDVTLYDTAWTEDEIAALEAYVDQGGLLVLTNSANRLKYGNTILDPNEDWPDANALAERFDVRYLGPESLGATAEMDWSHPLAVGEHTLTMAEDNAVAYETAGGQVLATAGVRPVATLLDVGSAGGQVVVLADLGILGADWDGPDNQFFWRNLARHAAQ